MVTQELHRKLAFAGSSSSMLFYVKWNTLMISSEEFRNIIDRITNTSEILSVADPSNIYKEIFELVSGDFNQICEQILLWRKDLLAQHLYYGKAIYPYLHVVNVLWDAINEIPKDINMAMTIVEWESVIKIVVINQNSLGMFNDSIDSLLKIHPESVATTNAAKLLNKMGYQIKLLDGIFSLASHEEISKLEVEINKLCKTIGGKDLFDFVLNNIQSCYDHFQERYLLVRDVTSDTENPYPQIPWGYLLQLAAKYLYIPSGRGEKKSQMRKLVLLTASAIALYEIQPYSIYESLFLKPAAIIEILAETVQYDTIFTLGQARGKDAQLIYKYLLDGYRKLKILNQDIDVDTCISIGNAILYISKNNTCSIFTARDIGRKINSKLELRIIKDVLENCFVHPYPGPNKNMVFPPLSNQIDLGFRPVIKFGSGYCLPPKSICVPAIFDALQSILRKILGEKKFDNEMGAIVENLLRHEFNKRGIIAKHGKYNIEKKRYECDLVIETETHILFFEIKKKILTRAGRSGETETLIDLCKTLLDSQIQAMRHQIEIVEKGKLSLEHAGNVDIIHLDGRKVDRISVTLQDFGSLQSAKFTRDFLKICYSINCASTNDGYKEKINVINNKLNEFRILVDKLNEFGSGKEGQPFFSAWFLSIPQILILIEDIASSEEFYKKLSKTGRIVTGMQDFYADYAFIRSFEASAKAPSTT